MRIKRWGLLVLLGVLLVATQGLTEPQRGRGRPGSGGDPGGSPQGGPPSDGQGRGGRFRPRDGGGGQPGQNPSDGGGRRGRGGDPNGFFDRMANGKDVLVRSEMDERGQAFFDRIAEKLGVTNGQITRDQFATYMSMPRESRMGQQPAGPTPPGSSADQSGRTGNRTDPNNIDSRAEESFRRHDKNGDGVLSHDEMPEELQAHLETFDADRNGLIDLNEYKEYYRARMEQRLADRGLNVQSPGQAPVQPVPAAAPRVVETKPVVYHADNLPKELPAWFKQLDTNHDAQIGLYEWRVSGRPLSEFLAMDRNNDGFLTVEEVLAYEAKNRANNPKTPTPSTSPRGGQVARRAPSN